MSSEHVIRIVKLRHGLEHCLVEQYSATTTARKDFYNDAQVWKQLNTMLFSWTEWLAEVSRINHTTITLSLSANHRVSLYLEKGQADAPSRNAKATVGAANFREGIPRWFTKQSHYHNDSLFPVWIPYDTSGEGPVISMDSTVVLCTWWLSWILRH